MHETNLRGPFLVTRACAPYLRKNKMGRVINISAFIGLSAEGSSIAHATAKAGLIHLNRCLANALAPEVTVNSVAPGLMEGTTMFQKINHFENLFSETPGWPYMSFAYKKLALINFRLQIWKPKTISRKIFEASKKVF